MSDRDTTTETAPDPADRARSFPVVGIGASAGGLQAYQELLGTLPVDTGMAFVLVQHLDRAHESRLVELLSRSTTMPVVAITDGLDVSPNHVYVIPPNATVQLEEGRLRLAVRADAGTPHPVDAFFTSLALGHGPLGIGVILSGSGTDGAAGIREIKAAGGISFAQSEASALHAGMPASAIATGAVDFVLPPAAIARELARLSEHPYLRLQGDQAGGGAGDAQLLQRVLALVRVALGVDFRQYRETTVKRRILRRVALQRLAGLAEYVAFVEKNRSEIEALYEDLLINVTSFFREPETFVALRETVFPEIVKDHAADAAIRVWVPACSTGQEAYSLAISLIEFLEERGLHLPVQVFATDISDAVSLSKARLGRYPSSIESEVSSERLRRFFVKEDDGYRVAKRIRNLCVFAKQNVATDPPFSRVALISCRNLFIYLSPAIQRRVLATFHFALNAHGFLVLGRSETAGASDLFTIVDQSQRIYAKQAGAHRRGVHFDAAPGLTWPAPTSAPAVIMATPADWRREADRTLLGQYAPPGVLVDSKFEILQFRGRTHRFLEPAPGEASLDLLRMAHEGLLPALRHGFEECRRTNDAVTLPGVRVRHDGDPTVIDLRILPIRLPASSETCYLVLFDDTAAHERKSRADGEGAGGPAGGTARRSTGWLSRLTGGGATAPEQDASAETVSRLTDELSATKDYMQSIVEQRDATYEELRSANEEVLSSNEELQSTNEELETAKEELQSLNEELTTVNEQLLARNVELVHTNEDLANLLRSPALPIIIVGADLRIRRLTAAAAKVFTLRTSDVGRPLDELTRLESINLRDAIQSVIVSGRPVTVEAKPGNGHWHLLQIHAYRTTEDRIDGAVLVAFDVDESRHAEARIRETQDLVRAVVETTRTALVVLDGELRVLIANPAFYETFGGRPEDTIGRAFDLAGGPWDLAGLRERLNDVLTSGQSLDSEELSIEHTPQPRTILLNARRMIQTEGQAVRLLLALEDVTSRLQRERDLRASESRYRQLFETSREGILLLDARTQKVRDVNRFFCNILDARREDVIDCELWQLGLAKDADASRAVIAEILQQGYARYEHLPLTRADGRSIEVEFLSNLFEVDGERVIQCVVREVTERKGLEGDLRRLAHELAQADRRKTQFLATLAHELRNPLAPIVTGLHVLQTSDPGKRDWAIGVMSRQIQHMVRLIDDLLDLSRITRGTIDLRIEKLDVRSAIDSALESVRPAIQSANQVLHVQMPDDTVTLDADPTRLSQMVANLLSNASKYTEAGGDIWLRAGRDAHGLIISVRDTGIGVAPEAMPHIFDMFFQADPPIGRLPGGLGIGLTLVRTIAELHGGSVEVHSDGLGRGTEFEVWLPLSTAQPATHPQAAPDQGRGIAAGTQRILIVDDNEDSAEGLATALRLRGQEVRVAADGERALEAAHQWQPQAIFLDLGLPGMSGYTVASRLRADPAFANTLIIAFTGYGQEEDRRRSRESGVDHHIVKPYDIEGLFALLRPSGEKH